MPNFTKKAIMESFLRLISEKPLDKITIKDIVEDCGITRRTFYYHYQDIFGLVEELFNAEAQRLVSDYPDAESWEDGFVASGKFILENRQAVYHLYNSVHRDELKRYIGKISEQVMTRFIGRISSELNPAPDPSDVQIISAFYINALTGFVWDWLDTGMKADPEQMIRRLGYLFDGSIRRALEKSSENRDLHKS